MMKKLIVLLFAALLAVSCATTQERIENLKEDMVTHHASFDAGAWENRIAEFMELYSAYLDQVMETMQQEEISETDRSELLSLQEDFNAMFQLIQEHRADFAGERTREVMDRLTLLVAKGTVLVDTGLKSK